MIRINECFDLTIFIKYAIIFKMVIIYELTLINLMLSYPNYYSEI